MLCSVQLDARLSCIAIGILVVIGWFQLSVGRCEFKYTVLLLQLFKLFGMKRTVILFGMCFGNVQYACTKILKFRLN